MDGIDGKVTIRLYVTVCLKLQLTAIDQLNVS